MELRVSQQVRSGRAGVLMCQREGILILSYEKANPPRGGGAKLRASEKGGSRAAERRHFGALWPILRIF